MQQDFSYIIKKSIEGNRKAQYEFFTCFNKRLFTVCMIYMNDQHKAEDLLQESWIEIFKGLHRYQDQGNLFGWLKTIVVRKAWKMIKRDVPTDSLDVVKFEPAINGEDQIMDRFSCSEILNLLDEIPVGSRQVFKMYVIEGLNHQEIAEILEIDNSTSRAHLSRARRMIRTKIISLNTIYS